jgi:hypothetical protein
MLPQRVENTPSSSRELHNNAYVTVENEPLKFNEPFQWVKKKNPK